MANTEEIRFSCPHCNKTVRAPAQYAGKKGKCPGCKQVVRIAMATTSSSVTQAAAEWEELVAYLRSGRAADITKFGDDGVVDNVIRFYEAVAADPKCPKLTYYMLVAVNSAAQSPFLVVSAGELTEHNRAWKFNYKPILKLAHPEFTWDDLYRKSAVDISNHSKPGCSLSSRGPFDSLAKSIVDGEYSLKRLLRPAGARESESSRQPTKSTRQIDLQSVIAELCKLVAADNAGFQNEDRIREIGEDLSNEGGIDLMRKEFYAVRNNGIYFSEDIWDRIGDWRC